METKTPTTAAHAKKPLLTESEAQESCYRSTSNHQDCVVSQEQSQINSCHNDMQTHESQDTMPNRSDMNGEATAPTTPSTEASGPAAQSLQNPPEDLTPRDDKEAPSKSKIKTYSAAEAGPPSVGMVRRASSSESVSSDLSSFSAATTGGNGHTYCAYYDEDSKEGIQRRATDGNIVHRRSPFREEGGVPPAPPSTPASIPKLSLSISFEGLSDAAEPPIWGTQSPLAPFIGGGSFINNAHLLEQQLSFEGSETPRFERPTTFPDHSPTSAAMATNVAADYAAATPKPNDGAAGAATPKPIGRPQVPLDDFSDWAVDDRYELVRILGRGSYGEVAQAIDRTRVTEEDEEMAYVAIKRIQSPFDQQVDAVRLYREIHILRRMNEGGEDDAYDDADSRPRHHECIIGLLDVLEPPSDDLDDFHDLYLVFEYVDTDLYKLIMSPQYLTTEHIQTFLYQMLAGLKYIHSFSVIHRDLKPANILLNEDCSLKICDFGLARIVHSDAIHSSKDASAAPLEVRPRKKSRKSNQFPPQPHPAGLTRQLTKHVVTRWYRAPELILIQPYTSAVDIWSLGCIFAELLSMQEGNVAGYQDRKPLFPGGTCYPLSGEGDKMKADDRLDQLSVIFNVIGTPLADDMKAIGKTTEYIDTLPKLKGTPLETLYPAADPLAIDLLKKMLKFNPRRRVTAEEALEHEFFRGVRRKDLERTADGPLEGPSFLEADKIDLSVLKQRTYEEVMWYRRHKKSWSHHSLNRPS